jgi:hypothetical protein
MGYSTDFNGSFTITPKLKPEDAEFLHKLNNTRRMARDMGPEYGVQGEFYVEDDEINVIDYNKPPRTQPGLWCQWTPNIIGDKLEWDGGEKFYNYIEWLQYIINKILIPRGYVLDGVVDWRGERRSDNGVIEVKNNVISTRTF